MDLAADYQCQAALPPIEVPDGGANLILIYGPTSSAMLELAPGSLVLNPDRKARMNCELAGCKGELGYWRDAGATWTTTQTAITAGIGVVLSGLAAGYVANRVGRHLPVIP